MRVGRHFAVFFESQTDVFGAKTVRVSAAPDRDQQLVGLERFCEVLASAQLCCLDRCFGGAMRRHHDDGQPRFCLVQRSDEIETRQPRHLQVGKHHVVRSIMRSRQPVITALHKVNVVALSTQDCLQSGARAGIVLN